MTLQKIFNKAATHLLRQGKKSQKVVDSVITCAYRGPQGTKCAIGCLIPDKSYVPEAEGAGISYLSLTAALANDDEENSAILVEVLIETFGQEFLTVERNVNFLDQLQNIHDYDQTSMWRERLEKLANTFSLSTASLK